MWVLQKFRFQTGSIKRSLLICLACRPRGFRFQTGSIKSPAGSPNAVDPAQFRFQTGSIKRIAAEVDADTLQSFDSKLVRLKVAEQLSTQITRTVSIPNWFD